MDSLQYSEYSFEEVNLLFENSSYIDLIHSNKQLRDAEARRKLLFTTMSKKNIVDKISDDKFNFTPAYKVFTQFAEELGKRKANENTVQSND